MNDTTERRLPIEAYSFEAHFDLKKVIGWLPDLDFDVRKTDLVARLDGGRVFVFDFGALVFVDLERRQIETVVAAVSARLPREPHPPLREDFKICVGGPRKEPFVSAGTVTVPRLSTLVLECIATVHAQSVAIDYYDEDLESILARVEVIANEIALTGRLRTSRGELAKFVASSIASQVEMIHSMSLLDKPDFTWDDEEAERLYDVLRHHLEIHERYRALERKLETIRESLSQFLEMNATRRALFLEATVVVLILIEIILGLVEMLHITRR
ncbi:MAG: RMD1 family protein [Polyangiaceae bacterium]|nr:RMD1 family protein [Polyangiaceae bacterium]